MQNVTLVVPYSAGSLEGKTALFGLPYGASAKAVGTPSSGGITHPDFRDPVPYEIIAPDGSTAAWTVSVRRYGEASGNWQFETTPVGMAEFRVTVSGLLCATFYEVYAENENGLVLLGEQGEYTAIDDYVKTLPIAFKYPNKLEVRFYDGADSATPVAVARCSGKRHRR